MKVQPIGTVSKAKKLRRDSSQDPIIDEAIQMLTPDIEIVLDHITVKADDVNLKQTMRNRILAQGKRLSVNVRIVWVKVDDETERQPVIMLDTRKKRVNAKK